MPQEFCKIQVPRNFEAEVATFVEQDKKAEKERGNFAPSEIELIAQFTGPESEAAILYLARSVGILITKAWREKWVLASIVEKTHPHRFLRRVKTNFHSLDREESDL